MYILYIYTPIIIYNITGVFNNISYGSYPVLGPPESPGQNRRRQDTQDLSPDGKKWCCENHMCPSELVLDGAEPSENIQQKWIQLEDTMVYLNGCISSCWTTSGESHVFDGAEPSEKWKKKTYV